MILAGWTVVKDEKTTSLVYSLASSVTIDDSEAQIWNNYRRLCVFTTFQGVRWRTNSAPIFLPPAEQGSHSLGISKFEVSAVVQLKTTLDLLGYNDRDDCPEMI